MRSAISIHNCSVVYNTEYAWYYIQSNLQILVFYRVSGLSLSLYAYQQGDYLDDHAWNDCEICWSRLHSGLSHLALFILHTNLGMLFHNSTKIMQKLLQLVTQNKLFSDKTHERLSMSGLFAVLLYNIYYIFNITYWLF